MRDKTSIVAVKLTATEKAAAAEMVERGYYKTLSAVLRQGLMMLLDAHKVKRETLVAIRLERLGHPMRRRAEAGDGASHNEAT